MKSVLIKLFGVYFLYQISVSANPTCPTAKDGMINVHLVCHTHDDVGWLKTVDQYYYGSKKRITWVGVQYILDSVMVSLSKDKSRKFIYVESAFFFRWWDEQTNEMKSKVKQFVNDGQLEFIGGGWCMNDEAGASYSAIIDQMTLGISKLRKTFGPAGVPRVAWQIDPFGHSREQASLFAQMGFDGLFLGRIDHADKNTRLRNKTMEFLWKGSANLGVEAQIFTGILPNTYSPPHGFCFDLLCADDPIMDDKNLEDYNLDGMVANFTKLVLEQAQNYATKNLIMTMGEDFDYVNAESWYKNLDKLIKNVNAKQVNGSNINLMYSTPSCYVDALHSDKIEWTSKEDDFFPYSSDSHAYWTGYFTSRPALKRYIKYSNNLLQAAKQIAVRTTSNHRSIGELSRAMGVAQHHDAVTGTAKQHVTNDYNRRLAAGITSVYTFLSDALKSAFSTDSRLSDKYYFCPKLNISQCSFTENESNFIHVVYNPLGQPQSQYVRIPISYCGPYKVTDKAGNAVQSQIIPLPKTLFTIPGRESSAVCELVFYAEDIPPLGRLQFHVYKSSNKARETNQQSTSLPLLTKRDTILKKGDMWISIDSKTKKLKKLGSYKSKKEAEIDQSWVWYAGMAGNNEVSTARASGAYIFRPNGTMIEFEDAPKITAIYDGPLVAEIHQEWSSWVSQVLRIYAHKKHIEIEWLVGPIPIQDGIGKEIVIQVKFGKMKTNNVFYTDSNGRELLKRVKNYRPSWNFKPTESISQNYYPVNSVIILKSEDGKEKAALLNDRSQGGTSQNNGEMELMVHRRLLYDDAFGVGEPLNETAFGQGLVVRGKHYIIHSLFDSEECDFSCQHRIATKEIALRPIEAFSPAPNDVFKWKTANKNDFKVLLRKLPANINLLTLEAWEYGTILLRLEHFYELNESKGQTVFVDVKNLFNGWNISSIQELTLATGHSKHTQIQLDWSSQKWQHSIKNFTLENQQGSFLFKPMQIRTFVLTVDSLYRQMREN